MTYRQLIAASEVHLQYTGAATPGPGHLTTTFRFGAEWMHNRMCELQQPAPPPFDPSIDYTGYGLFKYGACLIGFLLSIAGLYTCGLLYTPLSVGVFYLFEIHFLFLFPLLIDRAPRPLLTSIKAAWEIGIGRCLITVIPIAAYMMIGLFRKTNPLRNWYIGCLSIIIWYNHAIRNRL